MATEAGVACAVGMRVVAGEAKLVELAVQGDEVREVAVQVSADQETTMGRKNPVTTSGHGWIVWKRDATTRAVR